MLFESMLQIGQVIDNRYYIIDLIGSGGMSKVYLAEDLKLKGKRWAIKECMCSEDHFSVLREEADMLIALDHPRLPRIVDYYLPNTGGNAYLIMDYIEGMTLSQLMKDNPGPLPGEFIVHIAKQLLEVLQYLHGQRPPIVYRDLKPGNIMLTIQKELMLIDFGIARSYKKGNTEDTVKLGTAGFAAPEQYGGGQSGPVSDLYGLGALLLFMATGGQYSYWEYGLESKLCDQIPDGLIPVIRRLLRHHPEDRYQHAAAVLEALMLVEADMNTVSRSEISVPVVPSKRHAKVITLLGVGSGIGTTHTSFAVSHCLANKGLTAWVDFSPDSLVYDRIRNMYQTQLDTVSDSDVHYTFEWKKVHFFKRPSHGKLTDLLRGDYQFVVLDLGTGEYEEALGVFRQSDCPILIASGADWRLEELLQWIRRRGLQPDPKWRIGMPLAERTSVELLQSALNIPQVYGLPFQQDPFRRKGELGKILDRLLEDMTEIRGRRKGSW